MSEEEDTAPRIDGPFPPPMSEDELREFVLGVCDNKIFTDRHLTRAEDIGLVFMVLALGGAKGLTEDQVKNIGCVWEWIEKAGPRAINGMPSFFSCRFMNKEDSIRAFEAIQKEMNRRKDIKV